MFIKSKDSHQIDLFKSMLDQLPEKKRKILTDSAQWHNVFYREVTTKIDEDVFQSLYSKGQGRPNAPVRVLVSMLILKEGHGWTDEQLFEQCRFNMKVMLALGMVNLDEDVPVESTYYDFKWKLANYGMEGGEDLLNRSFEQITQAQIKRHKLLSQHIRMDSKLIQSNICKSTRLHLIIETVRSFYLGLTQGQKQEIRKKYDREFLEVLAEQTTANHTYKLSNEEKKKWLDRLGHTIRKLMNIYKGKGIASYENLVRLYEEQYEEKGKDTDPKDSNQIGSQTLQSPHDPEAEYRRKGHGSTEQRVVGYVANITETCHKGQINLITDVQVAGAATPDNVFFEPSVRNTERVCEQPVQAAWTDGGYDSIENRRLFEQDEWVGKKWYLPKTKGGAISYRFEQEQGGEIRVTDLRTGLSQVAEKAKNGKYRIKLKRGKSTTRYFSEEVLKSYLTLDKVRAQDMDLLNIRANVESTIHQVFCKLSGKKSKYRGLVQTRNYVVSRSLWVNFQRIKAKTIEKAKQVLHNAYKWGQRIILRLHLDYSCYPPNTHWIKTA